MSLNQGCRSRSEPGFLAPAPQHCLKSCYNAAVAVVGDGRSGEVPPGGEVSQGEEAENLEELHPGRLHPQRKGYPSHNCSVK